MDIPERFKNPFFIILFVLFLGVLGWLIFKEDKNDSSFDYITLSYGDVIQDVSVTGRVKPAESVDLAFEETGKIAWKGVSVGTRVFEGQSLVGLDSKETEALLNQAKASEKTEEANLNELLRGTRPEEIQVQKVKVSNATSAEVEAQKNLIDTINEAYTESDDAVRNKVDQFITNPRSSNPQLDVQIYDSQLENNIENDRVVTEGTLSDWNSSLSGLSLSSDLQMFVDETKTYLDSIKSFLDDVAFAVNGLTATADLPKATIDGYKKDISTARSNVNTARANLSSAEEKLDTKSSALTLAKEELILKEAGATVEELDAARAKLEESKANVARYEAEFAKTVIYAPIDGIVTEFDVSRGEIVSANTIVISLISVSEFEIEANIPEVDIAKVVLGDNASVVLDAYGDEIFEARIVSIDPAETIIEGVPAYTTMLQFIKKDDRIRSGMTADITILTDKRENVLAVPQRSVIENGAVKFVRILKDDGSIKETNVVVGLRGSEGLIEIKEGVFEGDKIITFIKEE